MIASIADGLRQRDWIVREGFLSPARVAALVREALNLKEAGKFRAAGIGRDGERHAEIRGDEILWFGDERTPEAARLVSEELEPLRLAINAAHYLGLEDFEGHYAAYAPDAAYARHLDVFQAGNRRVVSLVLYLNEAWSADDGGALQLYPEAHPPVTVVPSAGTLACFLSERVPHEVRPARRTRWSLTGWFRRRA